MIKCKKCSAEYDPELKVCPYCGNIADLQNDECAVPTADTSNSLTGSVSKKKKYLIFAAISLLAAVVSACAVIFAVGRTGKKTREPKSSYDSEQSIAAEQINSNIKTETDEEIVSTVETVSSDESEQSTVDTPTQNNQNEKNTNETSSNGADANKTGDKKLLPGKYRLSNNQYGMEDWYAELTVYEDQSYTFNANCDLVSFKKVGEYSYQATLKYVTEYVSIDPDGLNSEPATIVYIKTPHGEFSGFVVDNNYFGERVAIQNQAIQFVFDN